MKKSLMQLCVLVALAGCAGDEAEETAVVTPAETAAATETPAAAPALNDAQIAHIVLAANEVDIENGELAAGKATDPRVKEFAQRMITDHTGVNKAATDLATRLGVTPEAHPLSQQLRDGGASARSGMQAQSGAEFDRAYVANEVAYHQAVIDALDQTLIPSTQNAELKALLEQSRPAFVAHLEHATELRNSLGAPQ